MLKVVRTFSASSSLSPPPYLASNGPSSSPDMVDVVELERRYLDRRGAFVPGVSSGRAEWDDERRTVMGGVNETKAEPRG